MYYLKCRRGILDSLVILKRFYTPPSRKTWSKQHPDFRTPRPLVEPYNLGRLHPDREWWKLSKKGLTPDTFMGFPDVVNIPKHGGSLYTHLMDGPTLAMIVYRCIEKDINDSEIWKKLKLQALKLSLSLDPYLISILYLYFSFAGHNDHRFISTFIGRILATLSQFTLEECSNIIMAMRNPDFKHGRTLEYIMKHAEALILNEDLTLEPSLRFLSSLKGSEIIPKNCIIAIGELIEMSNFSCIQEPLLLDCLDCCCTLFGTVDFLCVLKLFHEECHILETSKDVNHYRNIVLLNTMTTFNLRNALITEMIFKMIKENGSSSTFYEQCQYLKLAGRLHERMPINNIRLEIMKSFDKLVDDPTLAIDVLSGLIFCTTKLEPLELKLLIETSSRLDDLNNKDLLRLYSILSKYKLEDELDYIKHKVYQKSWDLLDDLSIDEIILLMDNKELENVTQDKLNQSFDTVFKQINTLNRNQLLNFIDFSSSLLSIPLGVSLEVTSTVGLADSCSNYLSLKSRVTPRDRGSEKVEMYMELVHDLKWNP